MMTHHEALGHKQEGSSNSIGVHQLSLEFMVTTFQMEGNILIVKYFFFKHD